MPKDALRKWFLQLLVNSRFWILITGIVLSAVIAGIVQLLIPSGNLQIIRIEQAYGFVAIMFLWIALLASPITKLYPWLPFKDAYLHARRAFGVLVFYYACLHSSLSFAFQLGGFNGIQYYNATYQWSLLFGSIALFILLIMAATSFDWIVKIMSFSRWKLLHRLVYFAGVSIIIHIVLVGSHFQDINFISVLTLLTILFLIYLQLLRIRKNIGPDGKAGNK